MLNNYCPFLMLTAMLQFFFSNMKTYTTITITVFLKIIVTVCYAYPLSAIIERLLTVYVKVCTNKIQAQFRRPMLYIFECERTHEPIRQLEGTWYSTPIVVLISRSSDLRTYCWRRCSRRNFSWKMMKMPIFLCTGAYNVTNRRTSR